MGRSGMHEALTDYDRQAAHRRNSYQETPSQILIRSESRDITQFANQLNGLIDFRVRALISPDEFISNLVALGLTVGKAQELDAAARAKREELIHEYAVCSDCFAVDGDHWPDCQQIN